MDGELIFVDLSLHRQHCYILRRKGQQRGEVGRVGGMEQVSADGVELFSMEVKAYPICNRLSGCLRGCNGLSGNTAQVDSVS